MPPTVLRPWQTLSRETILDHGKFLKVENHTVKLPDGRIIPDWAWVTIPSAAIVLAVTADQKYICFRQIKYAVAGTSLAPVGGMLEPGELPLEAGRRELLEETGYEADSWTSLGGYILDPNRGIATMHLYLAQNACRVAEPVSDDLEDQELLLLSRDEIEAALKAGEFKVLAWSAVVSLALNHLSNFSGDESIATLPRPESTTIEGPVFGAAAVCEPILRALPDWFGIEEALLNYLTEIDTLPTFLASDRGQVPGFITLKQHSPFSAEILVMGCHPQNHRQGIGRALLLQAETWLAGQGVEYLQVKTLGPSHPGAGYARTRAFYTTMGFVPLEELPQIWGAANPCLIMIKRLQPAEPACLFD